MICAGKGTRSRTGSSKFGGRNILSTGSPRGRFNRRWTQMNADKDPPFLPQMNTDEANQSLTAPELLKEPAQVVDDISTDEKFATAKTYLHMSKLSMAQSVAFMILC